MLEFDPQVKSYIDRLNRNSSLWESDGEQQFAQFEQSNPDIRKIKEQMDKYFDFETRITDIEEKNKIGSNLFSSEGVKSALVGEARKLKQKYGDLLNNIGRTCLIAQKLFEA
jgi:cell shape-determining protein MreC